MHVTAATIRRTPKQESLFEAVRRQTNARRVEVSHHLPGFSEILIWHPFARRIHGSCHRAACANHVANNHPPVCNGFLLALETTTGSWGTLDSKSRENHPRGGHHDLALQPPKIPWSIATALRKTSRGLAVALFQREPNLRSVVSSEEHIQKACHSPKMRVRS